MIGLSFSTATVFFLSALFFQPVIGLAATNPAGVTLDAPVHFLGTDGTDVVLEPGDYEVRDKDEQLEVRSLTEQKTIGLQATKGKHELKLRGPVAVSIPGYTDDEADYHYLAVLVPGGLSLETTGTYSGIQTRGLFDKPRPGLQQALNRAKDVAQNAKEDVQNFARLQRCQLMTNAIKMVRLFPENIARVTEGRGGQTGMARWRQSPEVKQQLKEKTAQFVDRHKQLVPELKRIYQWLNNPANSGAVEDLFSADTLCKATPADIEAKLARFGLRPNIPAPAGSSNEHFYMGLSKGVTAAVVGGVVASRQIVTDFRGNTLKLLTVGPAIVSNATFSATGEVMFYPSVSRQDFGGWSAGLGISGGYPGVDIGGAVDFAFGSTPAILPLIGRVIREFQGFGLGLTAGLSVIPVDGTNSYAYTWELPWWVP